MDTTAGRQDSATRARVMLERDERGLRLVGDGMEVRTNFSRLATRIRPNNLHRELLVRAAKMKGAPGAAIDATAGLGEDSFLLAAAGFDVTLYEHDPVIAALLRDALERAAADPAVAPIVARMHLVEADSIAALEAFAEQPGARPDVVYLDPMFPERTKSAAVKKRFQLLHRLERPCVDEEALLYAARTANPRKIVIKRPAKGPHLAGVRPSYSLAGKSVRFDVIALP